MQTITIEKEISQKRAPGKAIALAAVVPGVTVKFGMDVHAAQITVCRQVDGQVPQPPQKLGWVECVEWLAAHVQAGALVHSCYEAGPCGYGLHRQLTGLGVSNLVVVPQCWNATVKTDPRDARELCDRLERYVRGNHSAFSVVRVPTPEQEQRRAVGRQRGTLVQERQRCVVRSHGLMLAQGVRAPEGWWQPKVWASFRLELPEWLRTQVQVWQEAAVRLDVQAEDWTTKVVTAHPGGDRPEGHRGPHHRVAPRRGAGLAPV